MYQINLIMFEFSKNHIAQLWLTGVLECIWVLKAILFKLPVLIYCISNMCNTNFSVYLKVWHLSQCVDPPFSYMPGWATLQCIHNMLYKQVVETYMWKVVFHIVFSYHVSIDALTLFFPHANTFSSRCKSVSPFFKREISLAHKWKPSCDLKCTCFVAFL